MDKYSILKQYYGHSAFRAGQEALIDAILSGRDALCVMPTGGGKSLCYQIPALLLPGITLVVSPLISLMKDQVATLKSAGVPAAYINSSLTGEQIRTVYARTRKGAYKLIYVAPERLLTPRFLSAVRITRASEQLRVLEISVMHSCEASSLFPVPMAERMGMPRACAVWMRSSLLDTVSIASRM